MSKLRQSDALMRVIRWIGLSIDAANLAGTGIVVEQAKTWSDALTHILTDIRDRERAIIEAESRLVDQLADGVVEAIVAERCQSNIGALVKQLAELATLHAPIGEHDQVDQLSCRILENAELLARGVRRPDTEFVETGA